MKKGVGDKAMFYVNMDNHFQKFSLLARTLSAAAASDQFRRECGNWLAKLGEAIEILGQQIGAAIARLNSQGGGGGEKQDSSNINGQETKLAGADIPSSKSSVVDIEHNGLPGLEDTPSQTFGGANQVKISSPANTGSSPVSTPASPGPKISSRGMNG